MPELTLELISQGKSETFTKAELRVGRDPGCDVVFKSEEFPMVGRQHAVLRCNGGAWSVEDLQSTNGTFVNQTRIERQQQLAPGDTVRLGSDGPEIRVQFVDLSYVKTTRPAAFAAAAGIAVTQPGATRPSEPPPTRPAAFAVTPAVAPAQPAPAQYREPTPAPYAPPAQAVEPGSSPEVSNPEPQEEISDEEDPMNEERLKLLRNLVVLMVALVLVLGGIVISQMQQIADIRQNVMDMRAEAKTAVGKFQPELDARMTKMENTMNGMDDKIQRAEDRFVLRMEKELPVIMDREVEREARKIVRDIQQGNIPH